MSYDVYLQKDGESCKVNRHAEGGTFVVGGIESAELNITYNYSKHYYHHLDGKDGLRWLHNRKAKDCINKLMNAVGMLGTKRDEDYWKPTEGNAGFALSLLLRWAKQHPDAIFEVH